MPSNRTKQVTKRCCGSCRHFTNAPEAIEAAFPGMAAMGSGFGSARSQDGLCETRGIYLGYADVCEEFEERDVLKGVAQSPR